MAPQKFLQDYEKSLEFTARSEPEKIIRMLGRRIKESSRLRGLRRLAGKNGKVIDLVTGLVWR